MTFTVIVYIEIARVSGIFGVKSSKPVMYRPTILGILACTSRSNFMLSLVVHVRCFITLGPGHSHGYQKN